MPRFFMPNLSGTVVTLSGESAQHIIKSLRMKVGDPLTLCDGAGYDFHCVIETIDAAVTVKIIDKVQNTSEPSVRITLYQAMPKSDKMEFIVQKAVELGVTEIVPVLSARCISRPDKQAMQKKIARYNKIAFEAAKQSGRGIVPLVRDSMEFKQAVLEAERKQDGILFYECGGKRLPELMSAQAQTSSLFIGSEGGFEPEEVLFAQQHCVQTATLGTRILRCETAPLCAISILLFYTQNI